MVITWMTDSTLIKYKINEDKFGKRITKKKGNCKVFEHYRQ